MCTCLFLYFFRYLGETKHSGLMSVVICSVIICGSGFRCCIFRKDKMFWTSKLYELSAMVLPLEASRHAAIQCAYCFSCSVKEKEAAVGMDSLTYLLCLQGYWKTPVSNMLENAQPNLRHKNICVM